MFDQPLINHSLTFHHLTKQPTGYFSRLDAAIVLCSCHKQLADLSEFSRPASLCMCAISDLSTGANLFKNVLHLSRNLPPFRQALPLLIGTWAAFSGRSEPQQTRVTNRKRNIIGHGGTKKAHGGQIDNCVSHVKGHEHCQSWLLLRSTKKWGLRRVVVCCSCIQLSITGVHGRICTRCKVRKDV